MEVTESEPPNLLVQQGHLADNPFHASWKLTAIEDALTELELTTDYEVNGAAALLKGVIQDAFVRIYTRVLTDISHNLNPAS